MTLIYEAPRDPKEPLQVRGVGRDAAEPRAVVVALSERPTDGELRIIHEAVRAALAGPRKVLCDHPGWSFEKHGRVCPKCRTFVFGD